MKVCTTSSMEAFTNTVVSYGICHSISRGKLADRSCIFVRSASAVASAFAPGLR